MQRPFVLERIFPRASAMAFSSFGLSLPPGIMAFCNLMLAHKPEKWTDNERGRMAKGEEGAEQRLSGRSDKKEGVGRGC